MRSVTDGFRVLVAHVLGVVEEDMGWEGLSTAAVFR